MPKKIDYLVVTPAASNQNDSSETQEEEGARPASRGPRGRGRGRSSGGPRPNTGYRGPAGTTAGGGFRRGPGGPGRPGAIGAGAGTAGGVQRRGFGGMTRLAPLERQTPRVAIPPYLTVQELADLMNIKPAEVIREMMNKHNFYATINQEIDYDTAAIVAIGLGYEVEQARLEEEEDLGETLSAQLD